MQLGNPGASNINLLFSDTSVFRNEDYVISSGNGFYGGKWVSAVSAKFSTIQMRNPAASGITILIDAVIITVDTAQFVRVVASSIELASLSTDDGNKDLGQAQGSGELRFENTVSGHAGSRLMLNLAAGIPFTLRPKFPWKINPEEQLTVQGELVNTGVTASYEWREI